MRAADTGTPLESIKQVPHGDVGDATSTIDSPSRALQACYFMLGMGLLAACCSIWQCMDYMNVVYKGFHPSRVLSTGYNMLYMVVVFTLFFGGPRLWPNKQGRMLTGYGMYVFAIAVPPLVDTLTHRLLPVDTDLTAVLTIWAVGAAVAGAADAVISSVVYVEAATLGPAYTHAFLAGKAACGLTMAIIRCASKAGFQASAPHLASPGKDINTLQMGTTVFLAAGAVLVAVCVLIVAMVLPRLQAGMAQQALPPTLTIRKTLVAGQSIALGHAVPPQVALLPLSNTLTGMVPGIEGAVLLPAFTTSVSPTATGATSFKLARLNTAVTLYGVHSSRLLSPMGTMTPTWSMARPTAARRRRARSPNDVVQNGSSGSGSSKYLGSADNSGVAGEGSSSGRQVQKTGSRFGFFRWSSSRRSSVSPSGCYSPEGTYRGSPYSHDGAEASRQSTPIPTGSSKGMGQASSPNRSRLHGPVGPQMGDPGQISPRDQLPAPSRSDSGNGHVSLDTAALSDAAGAAAASSLKNRSQQSGQFSWQHSSSPVDDDSAKQLHALTSSPHGPPLHSRDSTPEAGSRHEVLVGGHTVSVDDHHDSPFYMFQALQAAHQLQPVQEKEATTFKDLAEDGPVEPTIREALLAVWLTMKVIYPYQAAAAMPPLITAAILPMIFSQDFSQSVLGAWYVQVAAVTYQLGGFLGSALIPIPGSLQHPKTTLLTASLAMLAFAGAFACVLQLNGGPFAFIALAFIMYMYSGYLNSCTFCLAGKGLLADDAQMVQMVLVLSTSVSFVLGGFISWVWVAIPKQ